MRQHRHPEIEPRHLERLAIVYVRLARRPGVREHSGSTAHQREQRKYAIRWGWPEKAIEVIEDLGLSGASADREGFKRLLELVGQERVGVLLASDCSRLTRSTSDLVRLLQLCRDTGTLLAIDGAIVDLDDPGARLLGRVRAAIAR